MDLMNDPEAIRALRRKRLAEIAATYTVAQAPPDQTQEIAAVTLELQNQRKVKDALLELVDGLTLEYRALASKCQQQQETNKALADILGETIEEKIALESERNRHQADLASLLNVIFLSNPTTVVPPPQTRPEIMDGRGS
jgi:septal ring factor EnvC (AmiA/AmiB activator)